MSAAQPQPVQFSPDGRWWWNAAANQWMPVPQQPQRSSLNDSVGVQMFVALLAIVLLVGVGYAIWSNNQQDQAHDQWYCTHYGNTDPSSDCP